MKIKIDKYGHLWLERAGVMKKQYCPHAPDLQMCCGTWCPLFGEPTRHEWNAIAGGSEFTCELLLCQTRIVVRSPDFTDERGGK